MFVLVDASYVNSAEWVGQEMSWRKSRIAKVEMDDEESDDWKQKIES